MAPTGLPARRHSCLCAGQRFHHRAVPVIPVVHVKQWPLKARFVRYEAPMEAAKREVRAALALPSGQNCLG